MLIEHGLVHDLSGETKVEFLPARVQANLRTPLRNRVDGLPRAPAVGHPKLAARHVLVVEDELLVAMLVEDMLADAGCIAVGPFARVPEALVAARTETVDATLLDVNIAGEAISPRTGLPSSTPADARVPEPFR